MPRNFRAVSVIGMARASTDSVIGTSVRTNRGRSMKLICAPAHGVPTDANTSLTNLFDSVDLWGSLFETTSLGATVINSEFHFLIANPAFLTMFGYYSEELQRLSF